MVIRPGGGVKGIAHYLETGQKKGRKETRSELDERVVLIGDLKAMDHAVKALAKNGEKYHHLVLSFREDFIEINILQEIAWKFQEFIKAAFRDNELMCYAEAHIPRIKSLKVEGPEKEVDRFVHIHFVIPKLDLATHKTADPLGRITRQIPYIDAFQESINAEYGLASPKDNRRTSLENGATVIGRHDSKNLETFVGPNRDLKAKILATILDQDVPSTLELKRLLLTLGEVKVRNEGTAQTYFNLKVAGEAKGVNLKEVMFSDEFLNLSRDEKLRRLNPVSRRDRFVEAGAPRPVDAKYARLLEEWYQLRSKEVKYLDSSRKAEWAEYKSKTKEQKLEYLKGLERKHYQTNTGVAGTGELPNEVVAGHAIETGPKAEFLTYSDTTLGQKIRELVDGHLDRVYRPRLAANQTQLSVELVGPYLESRYQVPMPKFGQKIATACSKGSVGVYDFQRNNLNLPPNVAWVNLVRLGIVHPEGRFVSAENSVSDLLWEEFKRRKKKMDEDLKTSEAERRRALAVLQASLVLSRKHLWAQFQLGQELQNTRQKPEPQVELNSFSAPETKPKPYDPKVQFDIGKWDHAVDPKGQIEVLRNQKPVIRDEHERVVVTLVDAEVVEVALRLAVLKFGPRLTVNGQEEFRRISVEVASRLKVRIEFVDPELQKALEKARTLTQSGRDWGE